MQKWLHFFSYLIVSCCVYSAVVTAPQTVNPDAYFILPLFDTCQGIADYFRLLFSFEAVDFQPVRDLTLFADWIIWKKFKINTSPLQNVLWWSGCCFVAVQILLKLLPKAQKSILYLFGLLYAVYPIFAGIVSWGIARKHIQAHFFILCATYFFLSWLERKDKRNFWGMNLSYFLSVFSQPIGILWPVWGLAYAWVRGREELIYVLKRCYLTLAIFLGAGIINYIYYSKSQFFLNTFQSKTQDGFLWLGKFLALGHHLFQLLAPYKLAMPYDLNWWTTLTGYALILTLTAVYFWKKKCWKLYALWVLFTLFPLLVILNTPKLLLDPYVTIPSFGILALLATAFEDVKASSFRYAFFPLLIFWSVETYNSSKVWALDRLYTEKNFKNSPMCITATRLARAHYDERLKMPREVRDYLEEHNCLNENSTVYKNLENKVFMSQVIFFEDYQTFDQKVATLKNLGVNFFYPRLVLAALYIKHGLYDEARMTIDDVVRTDGNLKLITGSADPILAVELKQFCERIGHNGCMRITNQIVFKRDTPYF